MSRTIISWTDYTFNPWMGCGKVSAGCKNCYAERLVRDRMGRPNLWGSGSTRHVTSEHTWRQPLKWQREAAAAGERKRVFCGSLMDWCDDHPTAIATVPRLWSLIERTPNLDWQLLTKRPENIQHRIPANWRRGWPNVWLGTSIECDAVAARAAELVRTPAAVHFVSYEPALGPLDQLDLRDIEWVIYGGESGPGYRSEDLAWARSMRARCTDAGVAFFFKQSAAYRTELIVTLDGETIHEFPTGNGARADDDTSRDPVAAGAAASTA